MGKYSRGFTKLDKEKVEESKSLLEAMGIAVVQAPGEGEMQCSKLVIDGEAYAVGSQDYDALAVGGLRLTLASFPCLIQNKIIYKLFLSQAYMRKTTISIFLLLIFFLSFAAVSLNFVAAQQDPGDVSQVLGDEFNISKDKIPTDPEDIRQLYLKLRWTEVIENNKIIGPINKFFTKIQIVFEILIAHKYEMSLTFFLIFILWFLIAFQASKMIESYGRVKGWKALAMGLVIAAILAQIRIIKIVATTILDLIFKQENWWIRLIIGIVAFGVVAAVYVLSRMVGQRLKKKHKQRVEEESEQKLKEVKGFVSGVEELRKAA